MTNLSRRGFLRAALVAAAAPAAVKIATLLPEPQPWTQAAVVEMDALRTTNYAEALACAMRRTMDEVAANVLNRAFSGDTLV